MIRVLAAALLLMGASASPVGDYEASQMEMAGSLRLGADGRFAYWFDYGAVSEMALGKWAGGENGVQLSSDPRPSTADPERSWAHFRREPLWHEGEALLMHRYGREIRFTRVRP